MASALHFSEEDAKKVNDILLAWSTTAELVDSQGALRLRFKGRLADKDRFATLGRINSRFFIHLKVPGLLIGCADAHRFADELDELRGVLTALEANGFKVGK